MHAMTPCRASHHLWRIVSLLQAAVLAAVKSRSSHGDTCCSHSTLLATASELVSSQLPPSPRLQERVDSLLEGGIAGLCASGLLVRAREGEVEGDAGASFYTPATWTCESQVCVGWGGLHAG